MRHLAPGLTPEYEQKRDEGKTGVTKGLEALLDMGGAGLVHESASPQKRAAQMAAIERKNQ
jgi:hypothetical protein